MRRDGSEEKIVDSINFKDEQEMTKYPERFKDYKPMDLIRLNRTVDDYFSEEEIQIRAEMWKKRQDMERKVLNVL